ncbi:unnamed protein product, partial [Ectocarpus sp. 12 AP-2014]
TACFPRSLARPWSSVFAYRQKSGVSVRPTETCALAGERKTDDNTYAPLSVSTRHNVCGGWTGLTDREAGGGDGGLGHDGGEGVPAEVLS